MQPMRFYRLCGASAVICLHSSAPERRSPIRKAFGWRKMALACAWVRAAGRYARQSLRRNHGLTRKPVCPGPTRIIPIRRNVAGRLSAWRFCIPWSRRGPGSGRAACTMSTTVKVTRDISSNSTPERSGSKAAPSAFVVARICRALNNYCPRAAA